MICYVLAMGKQHLGPHVVVGYGIKIFWPCLFITSPDHLDTPNDNLALSLFHGHTFHKNPIKYIFSESLGRVDSD